MSNIVKINTFTTSAKSSYGKCGYSRRTFFELGRKAYSDGRNSPPGRKNEMVKITAAEYAETYDVSLNTAYDQLKAAVENIFDRYLQFQVWEGKKKALNVSAGLMPTNTFDKEGYVRFGFGNQIFPTSSN